LIEWRHGRLLYILRCADNSYYVGSATGDDLERRIAEHASGAIVGYTWSRRPVQLVWSEHFVRITDAIAVERQVKGWSRVKKEALLRGDWDAVEVFARRRGRSERRGRLTQCSFVPFRRPEVLGRRPSLEGPLSQRRFEGRFAASSG
jgi:putative endonuclease